MDLKIELTDDNGELWSVSIIDPNDPDDIVIINPQGRKYWRARFRDDYAEMWSYDGWGNNFRTPPEIRQQIEKVLQMKAFW